MQLRFANVVFFLYVCIGLCDIDSPQSGSSIILDIEESRGNRKYLPVYWSGYYLLVFLYGKIIQPEVSSLEDSTFAMTFTYAVQRAGLKDSATVFVCRSRCRVSSKCVQRRDRFMHRKSTYMRYYSNQVCLLIEKHAGSVAKKMRSTGWLKFKHWFGYLVYEV